MSSSRVETLALHCGIEPELFERYVSPVVIDKVFDTNISFLECLTHAAKTSVGKNVQFAPLTVSTMTITGKFKHELDIEMPIDRIREALSARPPGEGLYLGGVKPPPKRRSAIVKDPPDVRKFKHQISFMLDKKSAKLFYNGTVHATGFSSLVDFLHMIILVAQFVEEMVDIPMNFDDFNINMINSGTVVQTNNFPLSFPPKVVYLHAQRAGIEAFFDPERHPAVKLLLFDKTKKVSTAFIFGTGNIVIFGSRDTVYISKMFDVIANLLDDISHLGTLTDLRKTTVKKEFDVSHGYLTASYKLCVQACKE
jgi:TATA-box binding protein (TBP) (component of TFIID and TFIIIB)